MGEQALYTNVGGPEVMRAQIDRLLSDIDLPSLTLEILSATAPVDMLPVVGRLPPLTEPGKPTRAATPAWGSGPRCYFWLRLRLLDVEVQVGSPPDLQFSARTQGAGAHQVHIRCTSRSAKCAEVARFASGCE
ncbi:Scr1 family TA system antitoxin-like transcriptional regulator [Streptomyces sp. NRRL F-5755]|uniref:Scr1 family TA system antitoxin-like transcriptional regulator n=1 Tax=Streptomyces sp. NRRL F-5755 TaxID=1519475 RepID=UPI001F15D583|nr:Scr1 family TA system antitoxin-like transcriptional regulator [Streptomyces sp. NRRL F-5755]